jgi:glyoxylase-like metal-dependent hydrolase (beta-lactamase superfamily II)
MEQLTANLWNAQSRLYATNSGIFVDRGRACLIDPCILPDEIQAIASFLEDRQAVVEAIVITHSHWDHILGPQHFPGVRILAQANYHSEVAGDLGAAILRIVAEWEEQNGVERESPFAIPQPDETFEETMDLDIGGLSLRLLHAPGHTSDQLVVYEPGAGVLWAADMLSDIEIPFVGHSLPDYERTLSQLSELDTQVLIPGHGSPTSDKAEIFSILAQDRTYLAELGERVGRAVAEGRSVEETVALCGDMQYRRCEENEGPHRLNVENVYIELGGEADATEVGWGQHKV